MLDLLANYARLPSIDEEGEVYSAQTLEACPACRIAKDDQGNPALLFSLAGSGAPSTSMRIELRNLSYSPACHIAVRSKSAPRRTERVALLKCVTQDASLREYFLKILAPVVAGLPACPTEEQITLAVGKIAELFRALEEPSNTSLQGLWCELLLIWGSHRPRQAAKAWHATPESLHDFSAGLQAIEVKSCITPHRIHHFSLDQVLNQAGSDVVIASFILEDGGRGISIGDLRNQVVEECELSSSLQQRVDRIIGLTLGRDWRLASRAVFDPIQAWDSLRIYGAADVPRVNLDIPPEVSSVRFSSELTDAPFMSKSDVSKMGALFNAVFGRG